MPLKSHSYFLILLLTCNTQNAMYKNPFARMTHTTPLKNVLAPFGSILTIHSKHAAFKGQKNQNPNLYYCKYKQEFLKQNWCHNPGIACACSDERYETMLRDNPRLFVHVGSRESGW